MAVDPLSVISAGMPILGGIVGNIASGGDRYAARQQIEKAVKDLEAVGVPAIEAQQIILEKYKSAGQLTPELEQAISQGPSAYNDIEVDPRLKEHSMAALDELTGIADGGGYRLQDKAAVNKVLNEIGTANRGSNEAIVADMKARGQYGSGLELATRMNNQQQQATQANLVGLDIAAEGQNRALDAIMNRGQMAGDMRAQEFGEKSTIAGANDAIDRYNAGNRQAVAGANVDRTNNANQYNVTNAQRIADANTDTSQRQEVHNKGLVQQDYNNRLDKAKSLANARGGAASEMSKGADQTASMWSGIGQGVGQATSAIADRKLTEEYLKKKYG